MPARADPLPLHTLRQPELHPRPVQALVVLLHLEVHVAGQVVGEETEAQFEGPRLLIH
jgi:hypothetical protein